MCQVPVLRSNRMTSLTLSVKRYLYLLIIFLTSVTQSLSIRSCFVWISVIKSAKSGQIRRAVLLTGCRTFLMLSLLAALREPCVHVYLIVRLSVYLQPEQMCS